MNYSLAALNYRTSTFATSIFDDTIAIMGKQRASKYKLWLCAGISSLYTVF